MQREMLADVANRPAFRESGRAMGVAESQPWRDSERVRFPALVPAIFGPMPTVFFPWRPTYNLFRRYLADGSVRRGRYAAMNAQFWAPVSPVRVRIGKDFHSCGRL